MIKKQNKKQKKKQKYNEKSLSANNHNKKFKLKN